MVALLGWVMLAAAVGKVETPESAFRAWRGCIAEVTRVAARENRLPEEVSALLADACSDQKARYATAAHASNKASGSADAAVAARTNAVLAANLRRYAYFSVTGRWPER